MLSRMPLLGLFALGCSGHGTEQLPPLGEVVVSIDTDAPVPELIGRLRVDVFDEQGTWLESRDMARTNPSDWPASFSLYTEDGEGKVAAPRRVLVRARAYLEGRLRSYQGERFEPRPKYVEPQVAGTLDELCDNPPALVLGQSLTVRRGSRTLTGTIAEQRPADAPADWVPQCGRYTAGGAAAVRLNITEAGDYRIEATAVRPAPILGGDTIFFLRTDCRDPLSQIVCLDDAIPFADGSAEASLVSNLLPRLITHLDVGSYTLLAGGFQNTPSDITLRATLASKWNEPLTNSEPPLPVAGLPRLMIEGRDLTPRQEPLPSVSIDRLALISLVPGEKRFAPITLRVACAGQMAKLSQAASNALPVIAEAETCVDSEGVSVPLVDEPKTIEAPTHSLVGTFRHGAACPAAPKQNAAICVPAGQFVMGSTAAAFQQDGSSVERFALMNRFWLDKTEVTVGRYRALHSRGFRSPTATPIENDAPYFTGMLDLPIHLCSYSTTATSSSESREEFPITCVDWDAARAFCRFAGGDLPTEAQWQYAASKAGKPFKTSFPWGDDAPSCDRVVAQRADPPGESACIAKGSSLAPVTDAVAVQDATPLGVLDLGGNASEWGLDSFTRFDSPCWKAASLVDPICWEENAPERPVLGGDCFHGISRTLSYSRVAASPGGYLFQEGDSTVAVGVGGFETSFRCAYREEPQ